MRFFHEPVLRIFNAKSNSWISIDSFENIYFDENDLVSFIYRSIYIIRFDLFRYRLIRILRYFIETSLSIRILLIIEKTKDMGYRQLGAKKPSHFTASLKRPKHRLKAELFKYSICWL